MERESRQEKFRRIAETRMNRIFTNMNLIANLSNKKHYSYSQQEVDELFNAYQNKGIEIRNLFENSPSGEIILSKDFSFSSKEDKNNDADEQNIKFRRIAENRMNRVFGDMNLKQWIEFVGYHEERHMEQIHEIKEKLLKYNNLIFYITFINIKTK